MLIRLWLLKSDVSDKRLRQSQFHSTLEADSMSTWLYLPVIPTDLIVWPRDCWCILGFLLSQVLFFHVITMLDDGHGNRYVWFSSVFNKSIKIKMLPNYSTIKYSWFNTLPPYARTLVKGVIHGFQVSPVYVSTVSKTCLQPSGGQFLTLIDCPSVSLSHIGGRLYMHLNSSATCPA